MQRTEETEFSGRTHCSIGFFGSMSNTSNKRRKSDEWVLLKRCRFDSSQTSTSSCRIELSPSILFLLLSVPPVQSILPSVPTNADESAATSDVRIRSLSASNEIQCIGHLRCHLVESSVFISQFSRQPSRRLHLGSKIHRHHWLTSNR